MVAVHLCRRARARDLARDLALARDRDRALARAHGLGLARDLSLGLARAHAPFLCPRRDLCPDPRSSRDHDHRALPTFLDPGHDLGLACRDRDLGRDQTSMSTTGSIRCNFLFFNWVGTTRFIERLAAIQSYGGNPLRPPPRRIE